MFLLSLNSENAKKVQSFLEPRGMFNTPYSDRTLAAGFQFHRVLCLIVWFATLNISVKLLLGKFKCVLKKTQQTNLMPGEIFIIQIWHDLLQILLLICFFFSEKQMLLTPLLNYYQLSKRFNSTDKTYLVWRLDMKGLMCEVLSDWYSLG